MSSGVESENRVVKRQRVLEPVVDSNPENAVIRNSLRTHWTSFHELVVYTPSGAVSRVVATFLSERAELNELPPSALESFVLDIEKRKDNKWDILLFCDVSGRYIYSDDEDPCGVCLLCGVKDNEGEDVPTCPQCSKRYCNVCRSAACAQREWLGKQCPISRKMVAHMAIRDVARENEALRKENCALKHDVEKIKNFNGEDPCSVCLLCGAKDDEGEDVPTCPRCSKTYCNVCRSVALTARGLLSKQCPICRKMVAHIAIRDLARENESLRKENCTLKRDIKKMKHRDSSSETSDDSMNNPGSNTKEKKNIPNSANENCTLKHDIGRTDNVFSDLPTDNSSSDCDDNSTFDPGNSNNDKKKKYKRKRTKSENVSIIDKSEGDLEKLEKVTENEGVVSKWKDATRKLRKECEYKEICDVAKSKTEDGVNIAGTKSEDTNTRCELNVGDLKTEEIDDEYGNRGQAKKVPLYRSHCTIEVMDINAGNIDLERVVDY